MFQNQIIPYIRENQMIIEIAAYGILFLFVLAIFIEAVRIKREVHGVCKKIKRYFEVILKEDGKEPEQNAAEMQQQQEIPVYQTMDTYLRQQEDKQKAEEALQKQKDAKLLMDVIQEVF